MHISTFILTLTSIFIPIFTIVNFTPTTTFTLTLPPKTTLVPTFNFTPTPTLIPIPTLIPTFNLALPDAFIFTAAITPTLTPVRLQVSQAVLLPRIISEIRIPLTFILTTQIILLLLPTPLPEQLASSHLSRLPPSFVVLVRIPLPTFRPLLCLFYPFFMPTFTHNHITTTATTTTTTTTITAAANITTTTTTSAYANAPAAFVAGARAATVTATIAAAITAAITDTAIVVVALPCYS